MIKKQRKRRSYSVDVLGGYIYVLVDPRTFEVRWVGYTDNLTRRDEGHRRMRDYAKWYKHNSYNWKHIHWMRKLKRDGYDPLMICIAQGSCKYLFEVVEPLLIAQYRADGANLNNLQDGGAGNRRSRLRPHKPYDLSVEARRKMSENGRRNVQQLHVSGKAMEGTRAAQEAMRQPGGYYSSEKHREVGRNLSEKGLVTRQLRREDPAIRQEQAETWSQAAKERDSGGKINTYRDICSCLDDQGRPRAFHPGAFGNHIRKNPDHFKIARVLTDELELWYRSLEPSVSQKTEQVGTSHGNFSSGVTSAERHVELP